MPAPAGAVLPPHSRVTFSGEFMGTSQAVEIWSWGLTFAYRESLGATTADLATRARTLYTAQMAPIFASSVVLTRARVSLHQAGGKVTVLDDGQYDQGDDLTRVPGVQSNSQNLHPLQTAAVVSFASARKGPTGMGRTFLPFPPAALSADYRLPQGYGNDLANRTRTIAEGMSGGDRTTAWTYQPPFTFVKTTQGSGLGPHAVVSSWGYASRVTQYRCGLAPDTMRSRRNALPESYELATP